MNGAGKSWGYKLYVAGERQKRMNANDMFTLAGFIEALERYAFYRDALAVDGKEAEYAQQRDIYETTIRQYVARFPRLESHPLVLEYEIEFLDP